MLCVGEGLGAGAGTTAVAGAGCNNNWDIWGVGSRLQWDVTKSFYIGVEAIYQKFDSAQTGLAGNALTPALTLWRTPVRPPWRTSRTGCSRSACTRTSCPDRLITV